MRINGNQAVALMRKTSALILILVLLLCLSLLAGCSGSDDEKTYDLSQVYQDIMAQQPETADDLSAVMFETSDAEMIEELYPGLGAIELKQEVYYQHAITGFCEIMLVEAADGADVQTIEDIFHNRIDVAADDSFYPETAQLWAENAEVQSEGKYVALIALPDDYTVPDQIFS